MGHLHCSSNERKNKHLTYRERLKIELMLKENRKPNEIALAMERSTRTIERELKRGKVTLLRGSTWEYYDSYSAEVAQNNYNANHECKGPSIKIGREHKMCEYIEKEIKAKKSPDVIANAIKKNSSFSVKICTKTIYNYLKRNVFLNVTYTDLIYGHYRKSALEKVNRPSYKNLKGRSIEERPKEVDERKQVGHWEMDLVIGKRGASQAVLLTLTERVTRQEIIRKLPDKKHSSVVHALDVIERQMGRFEFSRKFKTITVDNGMEFVNSSELERSCISRKKQRTMFFYAHPYSAYERGTNESLNRMIRRFIPKGTDIGLLTKKEIKQIENWLNNYPRKILDYLTPWEAYEKVS